METKNLIIDADYLLFEVTEGSFTKTGGFKKAESGTTKGTYKRPLKRYKKRLKVLVNDIVDEFSVALLGKDIKIDKVKLAFSDPDTNFRYALYPDYKLKREASARGELFYRFRNWALKKYGYVKNMEADDVVAYYAKKGWLAASFDKDLLKGCPGIWFDVFHTRRHMVETGELEARNFTLLQTLMGDATDNIKGIPRVGEKTAIKLLDEHGWDWDGVVKSYEAKGLTEEDAILNRRLVDMHQARKKKGKWKVKLFKP